MLKFSATQWRMFTESAQSRFRAKALRYLRASHADTCKRISGETLSTILDVCIARCRAHSAASQRCVIALAELSLSYGRDVYAEDPWVVEILDSEYIGVVEKADRLRNYL